MQGIWCCLGRSLFHFDSRRTDKHWSDIGENAFVGRCKEVMERMNALRVVDEGTNALNENEYQGDDLWAGEESELKRARILTFS